MKIEIGLLSNRHQFFGRRPNDQDVTRLKRLILVRPQSHALSNHSGGDEVKFLVFANFVDGLVDKRRIRQHRYLSQIIFQPKMLRRIVSAFVCRQQELSDKQYEERSRRRQTQSNRRNRKNSETGSTGLSKNCTGDEKGRRSNNCNRRAE